jgi:hypothetical protein
MEDPLVGDPLVGDPMEIFKSQSDLIDSLAKSDMDKKSSGDKKKKMKDPV